MPLRPRVSAIKNEDHAIRKKIDVSKTGYWPILVNLKISAVMTDTRPPIAKEPKNMPTNEPSAEKNAPVSKAEDVAFL